VNWCTGETVYLRWSPAPEFTGVCLD